MVERRVGSGTYVRSPARDESSSFGVLIPDLGETEIFEPMLHAMMSSPLARQRALLWASAPAGTRSKEEVAWDLCRAVHRSQSGGRVLRTTRAHRAEPRGEPSHRPRARRREDPDRAPRSNGAAVPAPRPSRSGRPRQSSCGLSRHRAPRRPRLPADRVRLGAVRGRHSRRARRGLSRSALPGGCAGRSGTGATARSGRRVRPCAP